MPQKPENTYFNRLGYKDVTESMMNLFGTTYCRLHRNARPDLDQHILERPYYRAMLKLQPVSEALLSFLPTALKNFKDEEERLPYTFIINTNVKMLRLDQNKLRKKINTTYTTLRKHSIDLFNDIGMNDLGATLREQTFLITHLYTTERNRPDQDPHTDYPYLCATDLKSHKNMADARHAWTAHMPITPDGLWITLYLAPGYGTPVHVDYGKVLLLRSDVVHGGGTPNLDSVSGKTFDRLHMYLDTEDQLANPGDIHSVWYDGITPLCDLYWKPIKEFPQKKNTSK